MEKTINYSNLNGIKIITGYKCNYHCNFCYQSNYQGKFMTLPTFIKILNKIPKTFHPPYITIMGGETTLDKSLIPKLQYLELNYPYSNLSITTNGSGGYINEYDKAYDVYCNILNRTKSNITFSIPTIDNNQYIDIIGIKNVKQNNEMLTNYITMLKKLKEHYPNRIFRINAYFYPDKWYDVYKIAKELKFNLTFCGDIKNPFQNDLKKLLEIGYGFQIVYPNKQKTIFRDADKYEFWFYEYENYYEHNNLIILPDSTFFDNFDDVINCFN